MDHHAQGHRVESVDGVVVRVRFRKPETGFTILVTEISGEKQTLLGQIDGNIEKGARFTATGRWVEDQKHGRQFRFDALDIEAPSTLDEIVARLKTYPGIGPATAAKIVEQLGERTWEIIDRDPDDLRYIVSRRSVEKIKAHHQRQSSPLAQVRNRLLAVGAPASLAKPIHEEYGDSAVAMIEDHPFVVAAKIDRFGFGLAEKLASRTGLNPETPERVDAGVIQALRLQRLSGHCCMPPNELTSAALEVLGVRTQSIDEAVESLLGRGSLRYEHGRVYLTGMAVIEERAARSLRALTRPVRAVWDASDLPNYLSDGQRDAVEAVACSGVTVLTGGPGTGKSTVVGTVMEMADRAGVAVMLCAPTGRAAKRLSEATGREASTIHRLLRPVMGSKDFHHDRANPLPPGLLVVDEGSMLDIELADALFGALTQEHRLLIVGDADQLPSVGPGNILADLIDAAINGANIALVRLGQIFRQADGSTIIANARRVLAGEIPVSDDPDAMALGQFYVVPAQTPEATQAKIIKMVTARVPAVYGHNPKTDIQVLCPVHRGTAGTEAFNGALQQIYSGKTRNVFWGAKGRRFCIGDRVMCMRNDYDRNVFNGDIGMVVDIDDVHMTVDFDGAPKTYKRFDVAMLQVAYAITIHKSQGGEFPVVLIPVLRSVHMLDRRLLYTAMTRARDLCILTGHVDAIARAVQTDPTQRWTGLGHRLTAKD